MKKALLTTAILLAFTLGSVAQQGSFAPQGAEWYFSVDGMMSVSPSYYHMEVLGDTVIQGHTCSIITRQYYGSNGNHQYVYEDNGVVYWYNQTLQAFTTLYDFNAEVGDTWICDIDSCSFEIQVESVEEVTWEGHTYRVQLVLSENNEWGIMPFHGYIIDGIGYSRGLFPDPMACSSGIVCGPYPDYLRCYLIDGEMLYHEGEYDCDEYGSCWDGTIAEAYAGGDGTAENPYQIKTSKQLALLAQQTNDGTGGDAYYELIDNINLTNCLTGGMIPWVSIGTTTHAFTGHFNGNGHSINNLHQNITDGDAQPVGGLFGCTNGAEINNVHLSQCYVSGSAQYVGTLVGYAGLTNIYNCSIYDGCAETDNRVAGGLVGFAGYTYGENGTSEETYTIANCVVREAVKVRSTECAGGVVGLVSDLYANTQYEIINCTMEGTADPFYVGGSAAAGGIVGHMWYGKVRGCTNHQKVVGGTSSLGGCVGGIIGLLDYGAYDDISDCVNYGQVCSADRRHSVNVGGIAGGTRGGMIYSGGHIRNCMNHADVTGSLMCGGIVGCLFSGSPSFVQNCHNYGQVTCNGSTSAGGILGGSCGRINACYIVECSNFGDVVVNHQDEGSAGGILGEVRDIDQEIYILNVFNRGSVSAPQYAGGILGGTMDTRNCTIQNVYNTGEVITGEETKGAIAYIQQENDYFSDCYWLGHLDNHAGVSEGEPLQHSCAFWPTTYYGEWSLDSLQFGHDLAQALNTGAEALVEQYPAVLAMVHRWEYDNDHVNDGFPVFSGIEKVGYPFIGTEWYYEIQNENGTITYQHLEYAGDTTVNHKEVVVIIRTNTLYDKGERNEVTREYVYEENGIVYWWNESLQEFTVLYDFGAEVGDKWEIKVGTESLTMHVDAVEHREYDGRIFKILQVSDDQDLFSGTIVCGIGHLSSFFPERLMTRGKNYRVEGIRCFWREGELFFKYGEEDCDAVYKVYHNGLEDHEDDVFAVYPNPTDGVLFVETRHGTSLPTQTYRITNLMGQILMSGQITAETQQIDVSNLQKGMYFITFAGETRKFVVR